MHIAKIRLCGFRSYESADFCLSPGLNVIVGANAAGKTNLVEAAYWSLRGSSPRTSRDDRLMRWGSEIVRAEVTFGDGSTAAMAYSSHTGRRATVDGVAVNSLERLRRLGPVSLFVPESLLLIKGGPARRRAHLDSFGADVDPAYQAAGAAVQTAVRQRNAQLARVRAGGPERALDPWDAQLVTAGLELERRRRAVVEALAGPFARFASGLAPQGGSFGATLRSPLAEVGDDPERYLEALWVRRPREIESAVSALGPHRDDLDVFELMPAGRERRDLRLYGSQGEQRAAVLALLLAEREVAEEKTGLRGPLFLDDVMSELDDDRRRLLVSSLEDRGQAIVTTTTTMYFRPQEVASARIIHLMTGVAGGGASPRSCVAEGTPAELPAEGGPDAP